MKILSMTATFGKLEHATLELQPGLNIIEAPNEWGKSTWCAFLTAMLYGIDTRAKSTKNALADKERYAPWSGNPMSGRINLVWKGRKITIERQTKGRIPLGQFAAFETETGLPVPELTAANCGQMLLGVERSVFLRAGFIRLNDLPVTQDEALRARLNALVTTGDESGDGERLEKALKDLKNRCRYNKTGLLPQAENEAAALKATLRELEELQSQTERLQIRQKEVTHWVKQLENHKAHLHYQAAQADEEKVARARQLRHDAVARLEEADKVCSTLPSMEETERCCRRAIQLQEQLRDLAMEGQMLPPIPDAPKLPECYRDGNPTAVAEADVSRYNALQAKKKIGFVWLFFAIAFFLAAAAGVLLNNQWILIGAAAMAVIGLIVRIVIGVQIRKIRREQEALCGRHGGMPPENWAEEAREAERQLQEYAANCQAAEAARQGYAKREAALQAEITAFAADRSLSDCVNAWQEAVEAWQTYGDARREAIRADGYWQTLRSMAKTAEAPTEPDHLTYTEGETARLLSDANGELSQIQNRLNQQKGRMEALGDPTALTRNLEKIRSRIARLEDTYAALTIAQETLAEAAQELQRRFAPRISGRTRELMAVFTDGRYNRLNLGEDLTLQAGAGEEDVLRDALWRSDGTIDQLYLALRIAVAEALAENAPLILDDALVRFDDIRLQAALNVLRQEAQHKQVILFTCQSREKALCQQ